MLTWTDVFEGWRTAEEELWRPVYSGYGWESWTAWRMHQIGDLNLDTREWTEKVISDPHDEIPHYALGGWNGWKQYRPFGKEIALFSDIVVPPHGDEQSYRGETRVDVRTKDKVKPLIGNVGDTTLIGLRFSDRIAIIEGTHRCTAIAVEAHDGARRSTGVMRIQLAVIGEHEHDLLERFCKDRPSSKK